MATISRIQRQQGPVYKALIRRKGRPTQSKTFKTKTDALRWARREESAIDSDAAGLTVPGQKHTLREAIERYRLEILPGKAKTTQAAYTRQLAHWEKQLGHLRLSELRPETLAAARDALTRAGMKAGSVNRYHSALGAVLTACAKRWYWITFNPLQQVPQLKEPDGRKRYLSKAELHRLLDACRQSESPDLYTAVLLSITTGARQQEILGMRWQQVDLEAATIHLPRTKNGDSRLLPIVDEPLKLLRGRYANRVESDFVFPSHVSRKQPVTLRKSWLKAVERAGLKDFHWHDMRHSAASFLAANGATLLEIGKVLGHRSVTSSRRYAHLSERHSHALVRGMADSLLGGDNED